MSAFTKSELPAVAEAIKRNLRTVIAGVARSELPHFNAKAKPKGRAARSLMQVHAHFGGAWACSPVTLGGSPSDTEEVCVRDERRFGPRTVNSANRLQDKLARELSARMGIELPKRRGADYSLSKKVKGQNLVVSIVRPNGLGSPEIRVTFFVGPRVTA